MLFGNYILTSLVSNKQLIVSTQDRFEASVDRLSLIHSRGALLFLEEKRNRFEMGVCSYSSYLSLRL